MAIYMMVKGQKQGEIKGSVGAQSFEGMIEVNSIEFGLGGPMDVLSGQATGRRVARPLKIVKPLDKSTPLLIQSCDTNENLTSVVINYVKEGEGHGGFFRVELTNAMVHNYDHQGAFDGSATDTISFSYTKAEITWLEGGISTLIDWAAAS